MSAPEKIWAKAHGMTIDVFRGSGKCQIGGWFGDKRPGHAEYTLTASIAALIAAAVQAERARCAKIARPNHNGDPCCPCEACHQQRWVADMIEIGPLAAMKGGA